ncbi:MAG: GYD domain-containing protein [Candidatus Berkiella sp.]
MTTYIVLGNFTDKGIGNIKESPSRVKQLKDILQAEGAKLISYYMVMGRYDIVCIVEASNEETMAKLSLLIGKRGNLRTETLAAFNEKQHADIIAKIA